MGLHQGDFLEKNASAGRRHGHAGPGVFFFKDPRRERRRVQEGGDSGVLVEPGEAERAVNQVGERLRGFLGNVEQTIDG